MLKGLGRKRENYLQKLKGELMRMRVRGRRISKGIAEGEVLVTTQAITFLGGVDPEKGKIVEKGHELEGKSIANKILVFPYGKGSTVGSYVIYQLKKNGKAPLAMINIKANAIIAIGAIISEIPMLDSLEKNPFDFLRNGMVILVNATEGYIDVL